MLLSSQQESYKRNKHVGHASLVLEESLFVSAALERLFQNSSSMCEVAPIILPRLRSSGSCAGSGSFIHPIFVRCWRVREEQICNLPVWTSSSALFSVAGEFPCCELNFQGQNRDAAEFKWENPSPHPAICLLQIKMGRALVAGSPLWELFQHYKSQVHFAMGLPGCLPSDNYTPWATPFLSFEESTLWELLWFLWIRPLSALEEKKILFS